MDKPAGVESGEKYERTRNKYAILRYEQNYATASFKPSCG